MADEGLVESTGPAAVRVGDQLRAARETQGLTLQQLAERTRIGQRYLQAIEEGRFADLPARTYALGFSRTYARALGLDEAVVARQVREQLDEAGVETRPRIATFEPGDPARVPSRALGWISVGAAVLLLAGLYFVARAYFSPAGELPPLTGESEAAASAAASSAPASAAAPAGPVTFTAREQGVWVKFYDGAGNQLLQKELALGEAYTVPAGVQAPQLWTARPDALDITIGGRPVPRISDKQRTVKDVAVDAASLLARPAPPPAARPTAAPRSGQGAESAASSAAADMPAGIASSPTG